jgi:low affinity Fe/Cu permease
MNRFQVLARRTSEVIGTPTAFFCALLSVVLWAASGPYFQYSETWQLVINTATTIVTFLLVFLIQNTQTRDSKAINLKLDELIRSIEAARNRMVQLEEMTDEELGILEEEFRRLGARGGKSRAVAESKAGSEAMDEQKS